MAFVVWPCTAVVGYFSEIALYNISRDARMRFDTFSFSPRLTQARWTLGKLASEDVPWIAQDALASGYDGESTRRLAGLMGPVKADIEPLMDGFFIELGLSDDLSREQAALTLACYVAEAIIDGREEPYEGARCIWWEIANALDPTPDRLLSFVGNASEYEDCSPYDERGRQMRDEIERQIVSDSRDLLTACGDRWR